MRTSKQRNGVSRRVGGNGTLTDVSKVQHLQSAGCNDGFGHDDLPLGIHGGGCAKETSETGAEVADKGQKAMFAGIRRFGASNVV